MRTFIVRLWVDLKIKAASEQEARSIAYNYPVDVEERNGVEEYDQQVGDCWEKEETP